MSQSDRLYSVVYDMDIEAGGMYEVDCLRTLVFAALNSLDWESSIWGVSFSRSFCYSRIRAHSLSCTYGSTQSSFLGTFISSALCCLTVERLQELDSRKLLRGSGESPFGTRNCCHWTPLLRQWCFSPFWDLGFAIWQSTVCTAESGDLLL